MTPKGRGEGMLYPLGAIDSSTESKSDFDYTGKPHLILEFYITIMHQA